MLGRLSSSEKGGDGQTAKNTIIKYKYFNQVAINPISNDQDGYKKPIKTLAYIDFGH